MKTLIILLTLIIFTTTNAYSAIDCANVKKTSPKYLLCKVKAGGSAVKNKLSKKGEIKKEIKDKSDKKSIFKKFGEAKSLSDLTKQETLFMKKIIILVTAALLSTTNINSEENKKLPDDCYAEYKISPKTFGCGIKKGFKNIYTNEDGSLNALGKFYNTKTLKDLWKK